MKTKKNKILQWDFSYETKAIGNNRFYYGKIFRSIWISSSMIIKQYVFILVLHKRKSQIDSDTNNVKVSALTFMGQRISSALQSTVNDSNVSIHCNLKVELISRITIMKLPIVM